MYLERLIQSEYLRRMAQKQSPAVIQEFLIKFAPKHDLAGKVTEEDNAAFFTAITDVAQKPKEEKKNPRRKKASLQPTANLVTVPSTVKPPVTSEASSTEAGVAADTTKGTE